MGFELEKRLASELNRVAEESTSDRDHLARPNKRVEQHVEKLKQIANELKQRLLGSEEVAEDSPRA